MTTWLHRYGWALLLAIGGVVAMVVWKMGGRGNQTGTLERLSAHMNASDARREADVLKVEYGAQIAAQRVRDRYRLNMKRLSTKSKERAYELRNDPGKLAYHLVRHGGGVPLVRR